MLKANSFPLSSTLHFYTWNSWLSFLSLYSNVYATRFQKTNLIIFLTLFISPKNEKLYLSFICTQACGQIYSCHWLHTHTSCPYPETPPNLCRVTRNTKQLLLESVSLRVFLILYHIQDYEIIILISNPNALGSIAITKYCIQTSNLKFLIPIFTTINMYIHRI